MATDNTRATSVALYRYDIWWIRSAAIDRKSNVSHSTKQLKRLAVAQMYLQVDCSPQLAHSSVKLIIHVIYTSLFHHQLVVQRKKTKKNSIEKTLSLPVSLRFCAEYLNVLTEFKPHPARTGRLFSQLSAESGVRHKANDVTWDGGPPTISNNEN